MASIYLIRHGQASFDKDDYDQLSELGFVQANRLGKYLNSKLDSVDMVIAGAMRRHQETAQATLAQLTDHEVEEIVTQSCWNEFDHENVMATFNPEWSNSKVFRQYIYSQKDPEKTFIKLFHQAVGRWVSNQYFDYKENWPQFKQRIDSGFDKLLEKTSAKANILVFTSGGPISYLSQKLLDIPETNLLKTNKTLVNCGVTKIVTGKQLFLSSLNEHSAFEYNNYRHLITYK